MRGVQREAKPFTEGDWQGFSGAERWDDQADPLMIELNDQCFALADANGIEIHWWGPSYGDGKIAQWLCQPPSQSFAKWLLESLPTDLDPEDVKNEWGWLAQY